MTLSITITPRDGQTPTGKLADAELHFTAGELDGMKMVGFSVWEGRGGKRNVTFPARQYAVNGERRSFALFRGEASAQERIRELVLQAYDEHERETATDAVAPEAEASAR